MKLFVTKTIDFLMSKDFWYVKEVKYQVLYSNFNYMRLISTKHNTYIAMSAYFTIVISTPCT